MLENGFYKKDGQWYAEDVPLSVLAKEYGTPAYIYSASHIQAQYTKLSSVLKEELPSDKQPLLCYACKANSNIAILKLLATLGSSIEVVSEGELIRALKAGFNPQKIIFEGVGKAKQEIQAGLKANIHQFNVESLQELELIQNVAQDMDVVANIVFRINPNIGGAAHSKITTGTKGDKFGLSPEHVFAGFAQAQNLSHVKALGIFSHIGSQISDHTSFHSLFEALAQYTTDLRAQGYSVERLDIGGGFPIQYKSEEALLDLKAYAQQVAKYIAPLNTEIIMEPGRYLVGNSGILLSSVLYEKISYDHNFLIIDAAMNDLLRPAMYDAWHNIHAVYEPENCQTKHYDIVGPVCESSDIFAKNRSLPCAKPNDLVFIQSTGAYGYCMSSNYNTRPLLAEVLVRGDKHDLINQRQNIEDILARETIPSWL